MKKTTTEDTSTDKSTDGGTDSGVKEEEAEARAVLRPTAPGFRTASLVVGSHSHNL